jgi:hypothetical protein
LVGAEFHPNQPVKFDPTKPKAYAVWVGKQETAGSNIYSSEGRVSG